MEVNVLQGTHWPGVVVLVQCSWCLLVLVYRVCGFRDGESAGCQTGDCVSWIGRPLCMFGRSYGGEGSVCPHPVVGLVCHYKPVIYYQVICPLLSMSFSDGLFICE